MERSTVSVSTGVMNPLLAKIATLLNEEYKHIKRVRRGITSIKGDLMLTKGLLEKLADTEDIDPLIKQWMKQVRELSYDMEDCIDNFMLRNSEQDDAKQTWFISKASRRLKLLKEHLIMSQQIQELSEQIHELSERRQRYKIDDGPGNNSIFHPVNIEPDSLPPLHAELDTLVGMDEPMSRLTEWLDVDNQKQLKLAAIVGMGGLGKTTLATGVYREFGGKFDRRAFVSLYRRPHIGMILRSLLSQISVLPTDRGDQSAGQLIDAIRAILKDKRYFVIIDDIWDETSWHIISCALPENGYGNRVLVTTRVKAVAESCCQFDGSYMLSMRPLNEVDSRTLFLAKLKNNCPTGLEEITRTILRKCLGLPLIINIIAGLLANKSSRAEEWIKVRNSIGTGVYEDCIVPVLKLSYLDLSFQLRTCLLYLSIFPEDKPIDRELLVRRWMAERFISAEHVGQSYFNELINRNLIQPMGIDYTGRAHACKVHDIVMDFIISKSVEENFVTIYTGSGERFELQDKVRRLSLDCREGEYTFEPTAACTSRVRSVTIFGSHSKMPTLENFNRNLQVLDLESTGELLQERYLHQIGRLYMLKYLRLQTTGGAIELPREIGKLRLLETLDLSGAQIRKLPSSIIQLMGLTYLLVNNVNLPDGIGNLKALQKLLHVKVDGSTLTKSLHELGSLAALRVLGFNWCISDIYTNKKSYADNLVSSLNKLIGSTLQYLYVGSEDGCSLDFLMDSLSVPFCRLQEFRMNTKYHFPSIPKWVSSLINLIFLEIKIDSVEEEALRILAGLPALLVLLLSTKSASSEQEIIIRNSGFRRLKQFNFTCLNSWAILMFEAGAAPKLEKLQLVLTAPGECVPNGFYFGIEHLTSLKHLVVEIKCKDVRASVVDAAEDAIKNEVRAHPNQPRLEFIRKDEEHKEKDEMNTIVRVEEEADLSDEGRSGVEAEEHMEKDEMNTIVRVKEEADLSDEGRSGVEDEIVIEKVSTVTIES